MSENKPARLESLDVFRGITIFAMILVNNPGSWGAIYPPLAHAKWNGCTPTDLIFPFFLFIVGVAITLALGRRKDSGEDQTKMILTIIKRGTIIFILGIIPALIPAFDFSTVRIPGVLQRIGIVYIIASILFLKTNLKMQLYVGAGLVLVYWLIMAFMPIPGIGAGFLEPGKNYSAYIDNIFLSGHMWTVSKTWDPEGILSTLPAISTAILGMMLGHLMKRKIEPAEKTVWMFVYGSFLMFGGYVWDMVFPINKSIWSSSYVLFTGGLAFNIFAMCYWLVDIKQIKWWIRPFVVYGMNAITVFFLSGLMGKALYLITVNVNDKPMAIKQYFYEFFLLKFFSPINASLVFALLFVTFWLGILWVLYVKKIFIKI